MKVIHPTKKFKKDLTNIIKSNRYKKQDLMDVIKLLANDKPLDVKYFDHALTGNWIKHRCHIKPDWLLIYRFELDRLVLVRTGSHSRLLNK